MFEAEGRALRRAVLRLGHGFALMVVITLLMAAGSGLLLWALYQYLTAAIGPPATALLTGIVALVAAGILAWIVHRIAR